jgi:hypothetical protein
MLLRSGAKGISSTLQLLLRFVWRPVSRSKSSGRHTPETMASDARSGCLQLFCAAALVQMATMFCWAQAAECGKNGQPYRAFALFLGGRGAGRVLKPPAEAAALR